jgi:probable HAF family extracellular repeat protein
MAAGLAYNEALAINDLGEIVGDVWESNAFPALYKQDPRNKTWSVNVLPTTSPDLDYGWSVAWGINDLGDVVGYSTDENWIPKATRWNSHDLSFAMSLGFPGDTSAAYGVNNLGIAVGGYQNIVSYDENGNPIFAPEQAVAVQF